MGFTSVVLAREAYNAQDGARTIDTVIATIVTCVFMYNTIALGLYGDISNDYTYA